MFRFFPGLFHKVVAISGSAMANFAIGERVVEESLVFAKTVECEGTSKKIMRCLKKKYVDEMNNAIFEIGSAKDRMLGFRYSPRFDADFFPETSFERLVESAERIPTLAMITTAEMGIFTMNNFDMNLIDVDIDKLTTYDESDLRAIIKTVSGGDDGLEEELVNFYIDRGTKSDVRNATFFLGRLTQLASDVMFNVPMLQEVDLKRRFGWPVYMGVEEFFTWMERDEFSIPGAFHGNELSYLFEAQLGSPFDGSADSERFKEEMLDAIVSFAKTGIPKSGGLKWKPVDAAHPRRYTGVGTKSVPKDGLMEESFQFWTKNLPKKVDVKKLQRLLPALVKTSLSNNLEKVKRRTKLPGVRSNASGYA
ncbi:hypothetical protein L596_007051 [Steinernema carpocapsae]|uniref:Carboxylesterase type B domain-containing protein n=1 Tax=Steinernema carpocapsae TaxID=34508 RepID=A0A4U5P808_STECR|nr:hypothetical protein L596_007051 [Steinernema carpocapsae]